ncbi:MAG TPA: wax ester/triacylglycerol synthase family O-acyltransferase [Candidatus Dormibacteraeota bacterium]|nr:wax ester/triacylglycerol synthase family O-acyltransferase [Candidatus Dormibacteraeota bacterium]
MSAPGLLYPPGMENTAARSHRRAARPRPAPAPEILHALELPGRMNAGDALFWYAESALPILRPIIAGLDILDCRPDAARMEEGIEAALAVVPRLSQRVAEAPLLVGLPEWVDDPHFDFSYHVRHISLPPPGSMRELLDLTATLFAAPLDRQRPLWEAYWIDGFDHARAAFFLKLHHSVVDGVGSMALQNALTQPTRGAHPPRVVGTRRRHRQPRAGVAQRLADLAADNAAASLRLARDAAAVPARLLTDPGDGIDQMQRALRGVRGLVADLLAPTVVDPLDRGCSGLSRRFDVMTIPLPRLQRIGAALEVTINDVVLTALAGALGAYHRHRHVHVETLNCMVPINLRAAGETHTLGNRVGIFTVRLPLAERRPAERLALVTRQTHAAKNDRRGAAGPLALQGLALLPGFAMRWIARRALGKYNLACTNVPGLARPRYMAGARIEAIYPFASVVEGTPLVMALMSYAGVMHVGFDTDPEAIPDPERIHALYDAALTELEAIAGIKPARLRRR